ncbi:transcription initiation factor TFIID component TAF4 [Suillus tomentosus]|nr:transcription initiation factor TFIID component TAF4 [Suillus tomentosus]
MDTSDVATLNDALGSAGVDLRAEEESLQRSHDSHQSYRTFEDRSRKQPTTPSFDTRFLGTTMRSIGTEHKVTKIPEDSVNYLAIALRARLQDLVTTMVAAANHRMDTQFDRPACPYENGTPMWSIVVQSDVAKQLAALEKIEREEEMKVRRERKERADMAAAHAANLAAQASGGNAMAVDGDEEGGAKKKKKKEGPGVTARNMSEDVRKKMSNAVASQAAGISSKYSWMNAANASTAAAKPKPAASSTATTSTATTTTPATTTAPAASTAPATSWARPYMGGKKGSPTSPQTAEDDDRMSITMRDAMFAIEKERGHGGGRGSARGWS